MHDDRETLTKDTKQQITNQDPEFDRIVGNPKTLKEGDFVRIEGIVFEISAIFPETKSGKRTIKLNNQYSKNQTIHLNHSSTQTRINVERCYPPGYERGGMDK